MLTITQDALAMIHKHNKPIYLNMPKLITNCCFDLQECPTIHFGKPHDPSKYNERTIQDITVLVPHGLPKTIPLTITVSSFLGFKRLVLEGWCLA
jgi:hypothetical protein